jgi:hypothetical protein
MAAAARVRMTASDPANIAERFASIAHGFRAFLIDQTGIELVEIGAVDSLPGPFALRAALDALDTAVAQVTDMASVYAEGPHAPLEPFVLPTAVLAGEYIKRVTGACWDPALEPGAERAVVLLPDGNALDLSAIVRTMLAADALQLASLITPHAI